jgi:SpoVK/Ycf46/Vps4 family AAA+-type ATPase
VRRKRAFLPEARRFGLPEPRGLFLFGVQGCGKSLAAKVLSSVFEVPLLRLDFMALFGSGASPEAGLGEVLSTCDAMAPVVLWIDEIDKLFATSGTADAQALARVLAGFLTWMQERRTPVFVVATANAVERLPPELLRKGRFDDIFFLDLPGVFEREEILRIHLAHRARDPQAFDVTALARRAANFSGAELEQVIVGGLYRAFEAGRDLVGADLDAEIAATVPLYTTSEASVKALREFARTRARPATSATDVLDLFRRGK